MDKLGLTIPVLLVVLYTFAFADLATARPSNPMDFIKASCRVTHYPALCVQSLSGYANTIRLSEKQLAQTALSVSLTRVRSASAFVTKLTKVRGMKPREHRAVKDCIENMGDSIDRLSESVRELEHMHQVVGQDFVWHMSNVQTWVSAALTDENTCVDGFGGRVMDGRVKAAIRRRISNVAQITSNALALVNHFASRHRTVSTAKETHV